MRQIRDKIKILQPEANKHPISKTIFVHPDLNSCSHVFIRNDFVRKSLQPPYDGPYRVIERKAKVHIIQKNDKSVHVSIDRLKPAYLLNDDISL